MRDFKIFVNIADIHIGIKRIPAEVMKSQLKKHFIKPISKMAYVDAITILGDIMHTIVSHNSDYAEVFHWFIDQVYKIAKKKNAVVIIIKGTQSHDNEQLNTIKHYQMNDDGVDFRIYETVEEITVFDDYKILVLPDVKVKQLRDVDKLFETPDKYDLILGHGVIDKMEFFVQESENMPTKTYVFEVDKLLCACKGPILFGHIHQYQCIKNQFYYNGPFTVLERGGLTAGFTVVGIYNKDRTKFKVEHYENPDSADYIEIIIDKNLMDNYPIDEIIDAVDSIMESAKDNDLVTMRIIRGDSLDASDKVMMLESRYRKDPRIDIKKKIKSKKEEETEQLNKERKERYAYIMDQNMDVASIMYKYYVEDVLPSIADKQSIAANIQEDDFRNVLDGKH